MRPERSSRIVLVRSAVSSFFEICERNAAGIDLDNALESGARGGGFILESGTRTRASVDERLNYDSVRINGEDQVNAVTTRSVLKLIRSDHQIPHCSIQHEILPPIGSGFGTSGAGALATAISISDLFDLHLTLRQAADYAHVAEIQSTTGLGTVISLASGSGPAGLVTEPGSFGIGKVDSLIFDHENYLLVCGCFGPVAKSSVLKDEKKRDLVNRHGRETLNAVLDGRTPEALLRHSRTFAEKTGIASKELLKIADRAVDLGALGATQNMIGNVVHCLVDKSRRDKFVAQFSEIVSPAGFIFESNLQQGGPQFVSAELAREVSRR
jgi:pantoate kinase